MIVKVVQSFRAELLGMNVGKEVIQVSDICL
jgi:hypothetical protein